MCYRPVLAKQLYLEGFFQVIRYAYDLFLAWIPLPMVYIILVFLLLYLFNGLFIIFKKGIKNTWKKAIRSLINLIYLLISLFYWTWGYNYHIPNQSLVPRDHSEVSTDYLLYEISKVQASLINLRNTISNQETALEQSSYGPTFQDEIREAQEKIIELWDWPGNHKINIRLIRPKGVLLRFSTSGIYIPHSLEGHVDAGMSALQYPATIAHEMAHGYGFTDEGFCNFIALLTCLETDNDYIQYSALLNYYRYLMFDLRKVDRSLFLDYKFCISAGIRADLDKIYEYQAKYPDIMPKVRDKVYDSYLKTHGVKEGLKSYNTLVRLVHDFKQDNKSKDLSFSKWLYVKE